MEQCDWRLTNQIRYLYRVKLTKKRFKEHHSNDHEHCEFCWKKIGEDGNWLNGGYCTIDEYHWICEECFNDFKDQFEWRV